MSRRSLAIVLLLALGCREEQLAPTVEPGGAGGEAGAVSQAPSECSAVPQPNAWASWVMPNPVASGLPNPVSYAVSESGNLVSDELTGLVWQRQVDVREFTWDEAKQYCACLELDGERGWRLPSRIELVSLVDFTSPAPSLDSVAFPDTPSENFWTASEVQTSAGLVYLVYFDNGHTTYAEADYTYRARCVRGSSSVPAERYELLAGTVTDTRTHLTWQQPTAKERMTWADAQTHCASLELDGAGWRLPSIGELQTLVDESRNPAVDAAAFPATPSEYFWASSLVFGDENRAWTTFFTNGSTYPVSATTPKNVRCVR